MKDNLINNNPDENQQSDKNKQADARMRLLRIIVPVLILLVAVGIYFFKNPIRSQAESEYRDTDLGIFASEEFDLDATLTFDLDTALSYNLPVMLDFGADACLPCKQMAPVLESLNQELRGKAIIYFIDVWKNPSAGQLFPLQVIPTQYFFMPDGSPYVPSDLEQAENKGFIMYQLQSGEHVLTAHQGGMTRDEILAVLYEMGLEK